METCAVCAVLGHTIIQSKVFTPSTHWLCPPQGLDKQSSMLITQSSCVACTTVAAERVNLIHTLAMFTTVYFYAVITVWTSEVRHTLCAVLFLKVLCTEHSDSQVHCYISLRIILSWRHLLYFKAMIYQQSVNQLIWLIGPLSIVVPHVLILYLNVELNSLQVDMTEFTYNY